MNAFLSWLRQPTTIHGLGAFAFAAGTELSQLVVHDPTISLLVGAVAYGLTHLGINDNSKSVDVLVHDVVQGLVEKKLAQKIPELWTDTQNVVNNIMPDK